MDAFEAWSHISTEARVGMCFYVLHAMKSLSVKLHDRPWCRQAFCASDDLALYPLTISRARAMLVFRGECIHHVLACARPDYLHCI